jgi:PAS domain S-box-containing protein
VTSKLRTGRSSLAAYAVALVTVAVAALARYALDPILGDRLPYPPFFIAIAVAAWYGGWRPALAATVVASALILYLFIPPRGQLSAKEFQDMVGLGLFVIVALTITSFTSTLRARLREAEARERLWHVTLLSVADAVITTDADGRVSFVNAAATELTGWSQHDARNQPLDSVFRLANEGTHQPTENPVKRALEIGRASRLAEPAILIAKDGSEKTIDDSAAPIRDEDGTITGAVLIFRDISVRREAERRLKQVMTDLAGADRRKNEFLALLAHELRNPLAPMRNAVQVLRLGGDSVAVLAASDMMERQLGQMVRLVDDLLDISRISRGKIQLRKSRIDLGSTVNHALEAARALVECRDREIIVTMPPDPVYVDADPARIAQVVGNLVSNACKFSAKDGPVHLTLERNGERALMRVHDEGIGIASEHLGRIFEVFVQIDTSLNRSTGGLGLGLTLVKELVEMHGGTIEVRSDGVGHGTEFIVSLPRTEGAGEISTEPPGVSPPPRVSPRRILVVDDNRDSADSLAVLLQLTGSETRTAYDGAQALDMAAEFHPDVVLLDIGLPRMSGYEVARRMRTEPWGKSIVLLAMTGWGQDEDRARSMEAGFNAHLVKPVDLNVLSALLGEQ